MPSTIEPTKVVAYGLRGTATGRTTVVAVVDHCYNEGRCLRKFTTHTGFKSFKTEEKATAEAKRLAETEGVPFVGFNADRT